LARSRPDYVAGRFWSCRFQSPLQGPDPTRPDHTCPRLRPDFRQSLVRVKFHYMDPADFASRPDQTHRQSSHMSRLSGQVYDQKKVRGLVGDPSGLWVWSGRVRVVESRNDTTRPDQRQSLAELTNVIWTDPVRTQQTLWETRVSNKVWPGPSTGTWTQQGRIVAGQFSLVQNQMRCVNTPSSVLPNINHGRQ